MKYTISKIFAALLVLQGSIVHGQDSSTAILSNQWLKVKNAQLNLSESIIEFCSVADIQNTLNSKSRKLISESKRFAEEVKKVSILDSGLAAYLVRLQDTLLRSTIAFIEKSQENKQLVKNSDVTTAGEKIEFMIRELERKIHEFNYWVNEKNGLNIRFNDINL